MTDADVANLKYFRVTRGQIAGIPVDISRTGYTGTWDSKFGCPGKTPAKFGMS